MGIDSLAPILPGMDCHPSSREDLLRLLSLALETFENVVSISRGLFADLLSRYLYFSVISETAQLM